MTAPASKLEIAQERAAGILRIAGFAFVALNTGAALFTGVNAVVILVASLLCAVAGLSSGRIGGANGRMVLAVFFLAQVMVLTSAFSGHPWQLDSHMVYFAALAALVSMADIRAILVAAAVVVVHHLSLTVLLPALIYPDGLLLGNIGRTLFHGAVVAFEVLALIQSVHSRLKLSAENEQQLEEAGRLTAKAEEGMQDAETAQAEALRAKVAAQTALDDMTAAQTRAEEEQRRSLELQAAAQAQEAEEARRMARTADEQKRVTEALRAGLSRLADGHLDVRIDESFPAEYEELRHHFNSALEGLRATVSDVMRHTFSVQEEVQSISEAANSLSHQTEIQSQHLEQTSSALAQITSSVSSATGRANTACDKVSKTRTNAHEGGDIVASAIEAMKGIADSSEKISRITSVIDDISFQTNLLALNAGVEAARAGDAGRGFAVVASEVRELAQRSSDAAREIGELISLSASQVSAGVERVEKTGTALEGIVSDVEDISNDISGIAQSLADESGGIGEINDRIGQIEAATRTIVARFEETSAASSSVSNDMLNLRSIVSQFSTGDPKGSGQRRAG
ncbi:methyl-accepting chemotaxis protein [Poseidonocella sedimentorum]|uniref:Methyl-accepting chemotaxis protein n=1 Tax=Poseidonocella sedimentorum TaxID=871652 RepID=A0A1I6EFB0_9RHOB|nr:methyl-accepting chemotaxis protein [Poseidonocella sedimentorum]SFR16182.1 methyl-accepting chemotaxis protein [Poseidonocella sedimentorum]